MMQFICALTCMQELGHLKDWELGYNTKLNSPRAKPIFLSLIQTLSTHWTQDSPDVLPSAWLTALPSSRDGGKNHRKCVIRHPGCHWLLRGEGRANKSPPNAPWLPSTQMMDSSWKRDYGGIRGFVFELNITAVSHM